MVKRTLAMHTDDVFVLIQLGNGDLVSGSLDSSIKICDIEDGAVKKSFALGMAIM